MKRNKALEILKAANEKRAVQIDFILPVDGYEIPVTMKNLDIIEVSRIQQIALEKEYYRAQQEGLDVLPVNEERWQRYVERSTENVSGKAKKDIIKRLEKEKPQNLAQQVAMEASWYETGRKYIPKILYVADEPLFNENNIDEYYQLIQDMDILTLLINKFAELVAMQRNVEEAGKNLKATASLN